MAKPRSMGRICCRHTALIDGSRTMVALVDQNGEMNILR